VFILIHDGPHGHDISIYTQHEQGLLGACRIIADDWDNIDNAAVRRSIRNCVAAGEYQEAINAWNRYYDDGPIGDERSLSVKEVEGPETSMRTRADILEIIYSYEAKEGR
jgi:hypothetical protein